MSTIETGVREKIVAWANATPRIRRVWVIGSRADGSQRSDGDLDLAIEVEPVADSEETLASWINNSEAWRTQLQEMLGLTVGLAWLDPEGSTPEVKKAVSEASAALIYERSGF